MVVLDVSASDEASGTPMSVDLRLKLVVLVKGFVFPSVWEAGRSVMKGRWAFDHGGGFSKGKSLVCAVESDDESFNGRGEV